MVDPLTASSGAGHPALAVADLTMRFAKLEQPVLDGMSLSIGNSEFVSLVGPSGCGKTTVLRLVAGLMQPDSGRIEVFGEPSLGPSRDKAMVFQHFNLFPWRTALANVAYGLELQGVPRKEREARAAEILSALGLDGFADHYPGEISGGMRQRVGLARALAIEPRILLMDEPFGSLDALTREYLQGQLEQLCSERKLSVLFVTHSIDEAVFLSDRVVVMARHPTRILRDLPVPLERPRSGHDAKSDPRFSQLRSEIWDVLKDQVVSGTNANG